MHETYIRPSSPRTRGGSWYICLLFHGHGLGKIPWLVGVVPTQNREMIREQLDRNDICDRTCDPKVGNLYPLIKERRVDRGNTNDVRAARLQFRGIRLHVTFCFIIRNKCDARRTLLNDRHWSMLKFSTGKSLCMNVGNLLDLDRRFVCNGCVQPPTDDVE